MAGNPRRRKARERATEDFVRSVWVRKARTTGLIAIDPGDAHVGVAFFAKDEDGNWFCEDAQQLDPEEFEDGFAELILMDPTPPSVVYERFRLYGDKAAAQKGSEFRTSQMIGVIKFVCRQRNNHVARHEAAEAAGRLMSCEQRGGSCEDPQNRPQAVVVVGQMADIKKPTTGILRSKKIKSVGKKAKAENVGWGVHCIDAELHGWYYILHTLEEPFAS
jgi:hypothetical protein